MKNEYVQLKGKVISTSARFTHVMAISLDPRTHYNRGVIRCITSRKSDITVGEHTDDRSELHQISKNISGNFEIGEQLEINDSHHIIDSLQKKSLDFIGFEDPDIWIDNRTNLLHLYFTIPLINRVDHTKSRIHLGHAVGKNLDSLKMTLPVLSADDQGRAKELSVAPINKAGVRLNLVESSIKEADFRYSVVRTAIAQNMGQKWEFGNTIFHPKEHKIPWIAGHASPGPLFSDDFIDVGEGKRLGIINGRQANTLIEGESVHGVFSIGLFIYDFEKGKIDWVSPEPFIQDSEAKIITFASQFVGTKKGEGILYAHVDDSFVRAYGLSADKIIKLLPA